MTKLNIIEVKGLTINDSKGQSLLNHVDLSIKTQQINAIIGESGAGKTLAIRFILNQLPHDFHIEYDDFLYYGHPVTQLDDHLGKDIGYISQNYTQSFNDHTKLGKQLIAIYRTHFDVSKQVAKTKVKEALTWVNLSSEEILTLYSFQLSGGQLERVYIASVLMLDPKLIIADEPVASLDMVNGLQIMDLLEHIVKDHHQTLLIVTHNMSHVLKYADQIDVIQNGQIVDSGNRSYFESKQSTIYAQRLFHFRSHIKREYHD